jgi:ABC-2 type transport system permease protein
MAVVAEPVAISAQGTGPLGSQARQQYAALAAMRWSLFRNSVRTTKGAIELGARTVSTLVFSVMALGIAFGMGTAAFAAVHRGHWELLPIPVWIVFLLWQVVPISLASFQQQYDMSGLLRFPMGFSSFVVLHLIFGLIDISTILGGLCCLGMWIGITMARPSTAISAGVTLLAFAAFNVLLVRAIFAWIDRWLAQRRTREMVMALFFIGILSLNFLNPAFRQERPLSAHSKAETMQWLHTVERVQIWFPAGAAAQSIEGAGQGSAPVWVEFLALLCVYGAAAGGALGYRLGAEFRGESFGDAPAGPKAEAHNGKWLLDGSGPVAAVMEKELRTLFRAIPLLYGVGAPLVMVFLFAGLFSHGGNGHFNVAWGLPISVAYVMIGFTQLIYNNLGTEGTGIQVLFLSPTPIRKFILGKNLFHAALFLVDAALVTVLAAYRFGSITPLMLGITWAWILFALPVHLAAGNMFSLLMPYRINMARMGRQSGAQANALLSILVQAIVLGVGAAVFLLCSIYARQWLSIPILIALALAGIVVWFRVLAHTDVLANRRREDLIATLVRTE